MPFKVTDFGTNRKSICDLPTLNFIISRTISNLLQIFGQICTFDTGEIPVSNTLLQGEPLNPVPQNLTLKKLQESVCCIKLYIDIRLFRFVTMHAFGRQMDRQKAIARALFNRVRCAVKIAPFC